jgi:hypothetical protein
MENLEQHREICWNKSFSLFPSQEEGEETEKGKEKGDAELL